MYATRPRFELITHIAYRELLRLGISSLPIRSDRGYSPQSIFEGWSFQTPYGDEVTISSYQEFCQISGIPIKDLISNPSLSDGCCIPNIRSGCSIILYNAWNARKRVRFTVMHEVGHLVCGHRQNGSIEEIEANFFASQFLMPGVIINDIVRRGYNMDSFEISRNFDVSMNAGQKKTHQMPNNRSTLMDDRILLSFAPFLDKFYPIEQALPERLGRLFYTQESYEAYLKAEEDRLEL